MDSLLAKIRQRSKTTQIRNSINGYRKGIEPIFPPTDLPTIVSAEEKLGFPLPGLLREIYLQIANGGIGPGHGGIYGLSLGSPAYDGGGKEYNLVDNYYLYRGPEAIHPIEHDFTHGSLFSISWFDKLLPICAWGDEHYSCIDCSKEDAPVLFYVGSGGEFCLHSDSFCSWIEEWVDGVDLWKKVMGGYKG